MQHDDNNQGPRRADSDSEERLVAHLFGELSAEDTAALESELSRSPLLAEERARLEATAALVKDALPPEALSPELRRTLLAAAEVEQRATANRAGFTLLPAGVVRAAVGLAAAALVMVALRPWLGASDPSTHGPTTDGIVAQVDLPSSSRHDVDSTTKVETGLEKDEFGRRARGLMRGGGLAEEQDGFGLSFDAGLSHEDLAAVEDQRVVYGDQDFDVEQANGAVILGRQAGGNAPTELSRDQLAEALVTDDSYGYSVLNVQERFSDASGDFSGGQVRFVTPVTGGGRAAQAGEQWALESSTGLAPMAESLHFAAIGGAAAVVNGSPAAGGQLSTDSLARFEPSQLDWMRGELQSAFQFTGALAQDNSGGGVEVNPPSAGIFYDDGREGEADGDFKGRSEVFFGEELRDHLGLAGMSLGQDPTGGEQALSRIALEIVDGSGELDARLGEVRARLQAQSDYSRGMREMKGLAGQEVDGVLAGLGAVTERRRVTRSLGGDPQARVEDLEDLDADASVADKAGEIESLSRVPMRTQTATPQAGLPSSDPMADGQLPTLQSGERVPVEVEITEEEINRVAEILQGRILDGIEPMEGEGSGQLFFRYWGDNPWVAVEESTLSTFAADVDTGSFGVVRRTLRGRQLPRPEQIRTEELVNWWRPDVPAPRDGSAFHVVMEAAPSRFGGDDEVALLRVALRGREVDRRDRKPMALTVVIDVSGSMDDHGRIGLVRDALKLLLRELSTTDSIALVTFGTEAATLIPMTSAANRGPFEDALDLLDPDGGTNVEAGLVAGYELAAAELTPGAVNRVVFLSDGVGNIGETDQARILARVEDERSKGIYLSTIGVGYGIDSNEEYADDFLEQLADNGDGVYHNVNDADDAQRYLVDQFTQTLEPIARDVKIQLEFDADQVAEWRQIGYENRSLTAQQFRDDAVDAGEVHSGHQVNALYEVRLRQGLTLTSPLATARVRWKEPFAIDAGAMGAAAAEEAEVASEIESTFYAGNLVNAYASTSLGYRRAVLIAQLAELLRRSEHATGDAPSELLDEMEALAPFLADVDFDELLGLLRDLRPALQALAEELGPVDHKVDEIRRRQIDMLKVSERLAKEKEAEARKQRQAEVDRLRIEIDRLEGELSDLLANQLGPPTKEAR